LRASDLPRDARALRFVDRNGLSLGTILGRDDRHTVSVPLDRISPAFLHALVAVEDRRFWRHGAVDGPGALRALVNGAGERDVPHGASTITMQLARSLESPLPAWLPEPISGLAAKAAEVIDAQRLENGLSKAQILEAYANRAPMGSNIYGVEAAARTYFGTPAADLDLAQAALLAALPNDPVRLDPYRHLPALLARRTLVLARMRAAGYIDASTERRAAAETPALVPRGGGIVAAPHLLFALAPHVDPDVTLVRTTIDRPLQTFCEAQVRAVLGSLGRANVHDAAVLVVDNRSGDVLAYVGSPDYFDDANLGRNDGVAALRQPGSALKPFLYEYALAQRVVRPTTILPDVPTSYALPDARLYEPTDYSQRFLGPVRVRIALADSLNVPAVRTLERLGVGPFLERLHELGFAHLDKPADYYGLGLTLGGGEVTLAELTRAYVTLARSGDAIELSETLGSRTGGPESSLATSASIAHAHDTPSPLRRGDPAWALVTDMLADRDARAEAFGVESALALPFPSAVKTGTSSDYRDTWTVGFTRAYTVGVWVGNFDGSAMRGISGVTGAAPLWNRIMLHLHERDDPAPFDPPYGYVRTPICATTGGPPDRSCRTVVSEYLDPGDRATLSAFGDASASLADTYDSWLIAQDDRTRGGTRILFPRDGDTFVARPHDGGRLKFEVTHEARERYELVLDGRRIVTTAGDYLWDVRVGIHSLELVDGHGTTRDRVAFDVVSEGPHHRHVGFSVGP
jgi:penicillin-binding protein 1C